MPDLIYPVTGDRGRVTFTARLMLVFVFLVASRVVEIVLVYGAFDPHIVMALALVIIVAGLLQGELLRPFRTPAGLLLVALTFWMAFTLPFSTWKGQSLDQFLNYWLKALAAFFLIAGLGATPARFEKLLKVMGYAGLAALLVVIPGIMGAQQGQRLEGVGSLGNSNEIAFHLQFCMPFVVLLLLSANKLGKVVIGALITVELYFVVHTVSREGLILLALLVVLTMLRMSFAGRVKLLAAILVFGTIAVASLNQDAISRYLTLFSSQKGNVTAASAELSTETRMQKLRESVELTLNNPVVGVGMGAFIARSWDLAKQQGGQADWQVSHNSYTQVSSETGLPGLALFLAVILLAYWQLFKLDRGAKLYNMPEIRRIAYALLISMLVLSVHYCFDSMAYLFYLPLMSALITVFYGVAKPRLEAAEAAKFAPAIEEEEEEDEAPPELEIETQPGRRDPLRTTLPAQVETPAAPARPNAFRLGRRR